MADRVSQIAVEVLNDDGNKAKARVSQEAVEVLNDDGNKAKARVSQEAVEVLNDDGAKAKARVSQVAVETLIRVPVVGARMSQIVVEVLTTPPAVVLPFIASATQVYPPDLGSELDLPFIGSATQVYPPTLVGDEINMPFIPSHTVLYEIMSLYDDRLFTAPGNGGERFTLRLNANGVTTTATLAHGLGLGTGTLYLSGDDDLPATQAFLLAIDDEILLVSRMSDGIYRIRQRGMSNTTVALHSEGAAASWTDYYDMAIAAGSDIAHEFTADILSSGSVTYPGWLICIDSSQAYLGGARYPMHVTDVLGVFDAGAGSGGTNRCDAAQPNAICTPVGVSDDCPAALSNPSRIASDITAGDVALVRYRNPEDTVLDLGPRSAALQSWFGLKRVDTSDNDVTFTDPNGIVVDTKDGEGTFSGSVNGEWFDPLGPGIAPIPVFPPIPSAGDVPYTTVTLPASERFVTRADGLAEKGWPMCTLAVRQGHRRIPMWASWDWHNFVYVYAGFGDDCTFAQLLIDRNGLVYGPVPDVDLPNNLDIDGPDAVWDDGSYYFGASWYVAIFNTPYLVSGPFIGGAVPPAFPPGENPIPYVTFPPGGATVGEPNPSIVVEGGSGGGIEPADEGLHIWQRF